MVGRLRGWKVGDSLPVGRSGNVLECGADPEFVIGIEKIADIGRPKPQCGGRVEECRSARQALPTFITPRRSRPTRAIIPSIATVARRAAVVVVTGGTGMALCAAACIVTSDRATVPATRRELVLQGTLATRTAFLAAPAALAVAAVSLAVAFSVAEEVSVEAADSAAPAVGEDSAEVAEEGTAVSIHSRARSVRLSRSGVRDGAGP